MALEVETKDCTALEAEEIEELSQMTAEAGDTHVEVEDVCTQRDAWVLITRVHDGSKLHGFGFCTLERIGGDPTILVGLAAVRPTNRRGAVLRMMVADQMRRAVLAFPDEDVLLAFQLCDPGAMEALKPLDRVVPRPGYEANGEDRAWGRRLAKRFSVRGDYQARQFRVKGDGRTAMALRHWTAKPDSLNADLRGLFDDVDTAGGDALVVFGWASREDLKKLL